MGFWKDFGLLHAINNNDKPEEVALGLSVATIEEEKKERKKKKEVKN